MNTPSTRDIDDLGDLSVLTFVIWVGCLIIGGLGFALPYARPKPPRPQPAPVEAEFIHVELANRPQVESQPAPSPRNDEPDTATLAIPQPIAVALPAPEIAFAVPVEQPARIVAVSNASRVFPSRAAAPAPPAPQPLIFGEGEGRQPAPEYPRRAQREGEEGIVLVELTVGPDGRVLKAEATSPSRWPLLNESALRAVKEAWRFSPGKPRVYQVSIRFELTK